MEKGREPSFWEELMLAIREGRMGEEGASCLVGMFWLGWACSLFWSFIRSFVGGGLAESR